MIGFASSSPRGLLHLHLDLHSLVERGAVYVAEMVVGLVHFPAANSLFYFLRNFRGAATTAVHNRKQLFGRRHGEVQWALAKT